MYAELVRNRAFQSSPEFPASLLAWHALPGAALSLQDLDAPLSEALPTSLNVAVADEADGEVGFANTGYFGIDVKPQTYKGSFWVRGAYGAGGSNFTASLVSNATGDVFGSVQVPSAAVAGEWTEHTFELVPDSAAPDTDNAFSISFDAAVSDVLPSPAQYSMLWMRMKYSPRH